jgi:hypothetical protein
MTPNGCDGAPLAERTRHYGGSGSNAAASLDVPLKSSWAKGEQTESAVVTK